MTTTIAIRTFTSEGVSRFRDLIEQLGLDPSSSVDLDWIDSKPWSGVLSEELLIEEKLFSTKLEVAQYLLPIITDIDIENKYYHQGLWSWLSAFYFGSVCPRDEKGMRKPYDAHRHIPSAEYNWRTVYRHLLAGPIRLFEMHGDTVEYLLRKEIAVHGDFMEQIASRQEIAASQGIIKAAEILYWDRDKRKPKAGFSKTTKEGGVLRRFTDVLNQLMRTYDLYSMDSIDILRLLPFSEFQSWIPDNIAEEIGS